MKRPANWPLYSFDLLLAAILALLLASAFLEGDRNPIMAALLAMVMFAGAYATSYKRWHLFVSAALGLPWLILTLMGSSNQPQLTEIVALSFFVLFTLYTAGIILGHVIRTKDVTRNLITAGISVYFLLGIAGAVIFSIVELIVPGSFLSLEGLGPLNFSTFLYFSLTTITTVGYGDIFPVTDIARMLSALGGAAGFLFIGVFIARLISQFRK